MLIVLLLFFLVVWRKSPCYISVYLNVFIRREGKGVTKSTTAFQIGHITRGTHHYEAKVLREVPEGPVRTGGLGGRGLA